MSTSNYTTTILLNNTPAEVFNAINNVRAWWSEEIEGDTEKLNSVWDYHYQDVHICKLKITELVPDKKIVWDVLHNYFSFTKDKNEWIGNKIIFEINEKNEKTELKFTQEGLVPEYECFDICKNAWNTYVHKSLHDLITTGKGAPNSKENAQTEDEKNLAATDFTTTFFVDQSPEEVFNAINNVRGWWQGEIEGNTDKLNEEFTYRVPGIHYSKQKITELIPAQKIVWLVTESEINFVTNKNEWTNTIITFEIKWINNKTQVRFTHEGLIPAIACYKDCAGAWEKLIQESLVSLITTGKGSKVWDL